MLSVLRNSGGKDGSTKDDVGWVEARNGGGAAVRVVGAGGVSMVPGGGSIAGAGGAVETAGSAAGDFDCRFSGIFDRSR
jgi:hypothetical protein